MISACIGILANFCGLAWCHASSLHWLGGAGLGVNCMGAILDRKAAVGACEIAHRQGTPLLRSQFGHNLGQGVASKVEQLRLGDR